MKKTILFSVIILAVTAIIIAIIVYAYKEREDRNEITLFGNVDVRQVDIGFRVSGQVDELFYEEGDKVKKGCLMCTLNTTPYDSQLQEAIAAAKAIQVNLDNAEILLQRRLELIDIGGVSQEDLDDAEANRDQLYANLLQAKAAIAVAKDNLDYTKACAPTDGIILTRIREPGTVVNPADPVYTLSVISPVWVRAFVDEPDLGKVYYGMRATVFTDSGRRYEGQVGFISPVAEFTPKTVETLQLRTDLVYRLRVYVNNPDHGLVQGMPVTVKLSIR
ncbi:MAG: efflux RND transporter periplasmic adaptor subunit [Chlamydiae bacterium CG10_big_fil_rev_8_21_14_0_10_35_9]|nr:MAG: efflux RND transporter periplasmic adaptor subunit [Chlamydiae bacterium CG10_big_fil_rev_8_21_14_0_10_35_9]